MEALAVLSQVELLMDEIRIAREKGSTGSLEALATRVVDLWDESEEGRAELVSGRTKSKTLPPVGTGSATATAQDPGGSGGNGGADVAELDSPLVKRRGAVDPTLLRRVHRLGGVVSRLRELVCDALIAGAVRDARDAARGPVRLPDGTLAKENDKRGPLGRIGRAARASRALSMVSNDGDAEEADPRLVHAEGTLRRALDLARHRSMPVSRRKQLSLAALNGLCAVLRAMGDLDGSEEAGLEALDIRVDHGTDLLQKLLADGSSSGEGEHAQGIECGPASTRLNLCATLSLKGRHNDALQLAREAADHLGDITRELELVGSKRADKATAKLDPAKRRIVKPVYEALVVAHQNMAVQYRYMYRMDDAKREYTRAVRCAWAKLGPRHPLTRRVESGLAVILDNPTAAEALRLGRDPAEPLPPVGVPTSPVRDPRGHQQQQHRALVDALGSLGIGGGGKGLKGFFGRDSDGGASGDGGLRSGDGGLSGDGGGGDGSGGPRGRSGTSLSTMSSVAGVMQRVTQAASVVSKMRPGEVRWTWLTEGLGSQCSIASGGEWAWVTRPVSVSEPRVRLAMLWMPQDGGGPDGAADARQGDDVIPLQFGLYALRTRFREPLQMFGAAVPKAAVAASRRRRASIVSVSMSMRGPTPSLLTEAAARRSSTALPNPFPRSRRGTAATSVSDADWSEEGRSRSGSVSESVGTQGDDEKSAGEGSNPAAAAAAAATAAAAAAAAQGHARGRPRVAPSGLAGAKRMGTVPEEKDGNESEDGSAAAAAAATATNSSSQGRRGDDNDDDDETTESNTGGNETSSEVHGPSPAVLALSDEVPDIDPLVGERRTLADELPPYALPKLKGTSPFARVPFGMSIGQPRLSVISHADIKAIIDGVTPAAKGNGNTDVAAAEASRDGVENLEPGVPARSMSSAPPIDDVPVSDGVSAFETMPQHVHYVPLADTVLGVATSIQNGTHISRQGEKNGRPGLEYIQRPKEYTAGSETLGMGVSVATGLAMYMIAPQPLTAMLLDADSMKFVYKLVVEKDLGVLGDDAEDAEHNFTGGDIKELSHRDAVVSPVSSDGGGGD